MVTEILWISSEQSGGASIERVRWFPERAKRRRHALTYWAESTGSAFAKEQAERLEGRAVTRFVTARVNAPMRVKLTASELVTALAEHDHSVAHLDGFFWEVPVRDQRIFAQVHGLGEAELRSAARAYGKVTNRPVPLVTGQPGAWEQRPGALPERVRLPPSESVDAPPLSPHDMCGAGRGDPRSDFPTVPVTVRWEQLLENAFAIMDRAGAMGADMKSVTLGGGTAMMLHIDHRDSHDIDLFLSDAKSLEILEEIVGSQTSHEHLECRGTEGTFISLVDGRLGEIDFIYGRLASVKSCAGAPGY